MVKVIENEKFDEVMASDFAVVDFSATWCGPCKMLGPVLEEVSEEMEDVDFFNVDVDANPGLAQQYRITNIPAVLVLKKGEMVNSQVGFAPKPGLVNFIQSNK